MKKIIINDQTIGGINVHEVELSVKEEKITLKELIELRVSTEVRKYQESSEKPFQGLVVPKEKEALLNETKLKKKNIDVEKQIYIALDGFMKNQYFVLINDNQVDDLNFELDVLAKNTIQFIKLTPLVGG